jgi:hypothetical protein
MHLADRRRSDRLEVEFGEAQLPALAVLASEHTTQLCDRHRRCLRAQDRECLRELRRQQVGPLQRDHLPELHRAAAQPRQPHGQAARIVGGEKGAGGFGLA